MLLLIFTDKQWCPACFVCAECREPFVDGNFFVHDVSVFIYLLPLILDEVLLIDLMLSNFIKLFNFTFRISHIAKHITMH